MSLAANPALPAFDEAAAEAFAGRVMEILNDGAIAAMIAIGHRSGLFDTLARMPPATSVEIARAAELNERYVREWLAVMVTARILTYHPGGKTYEFPDEHAAWLTRGGTLGNLAVYGQFVAVIGALQDKILDRDRKSVV